MSRFTLDADPVAVLSNADALDALAVDLEEQRERIAAVPASYASAWTGAAATAVGSEITALAGHVASFTGCFTVAAAAVRSFGEAIGDALEVTLPSLNRRWDDAQAAWSQALSAADTRFEESVDAAAGTADAAVGRMLRDEAALGRDTARSDAAQARSTEQTALQREFEQLQEDLRAHAARTGDAMAAAVVVPVPDSTTAAHLATAAGLPWLGAVLDVALQASLDAAAEQALDGGAVTDLAEELRAPPAPGQTDALGALLDRARALGVPPDQYALALQGYWTSRAADEAGIDLAAWRIEDGAETNRETIEAVYTWYASLHLDDPDLQWAGMAAMIGPSFAAGFFDLDQFRGFAATVSELPEPLRSGLPPGIEDLAEIGEEELRFYETTLLSMQREIFRDQGSMHQAYLDGGLEAVEEMRAAGLLDDRTAASWADVASADPARVSAGNTQFLEREQRDIIADDYDLMRGHEPTGEAMTWALTLVGQPSIPGASSYPDVFPYTVVTQTPGPESLGRWDNPFQGTLITETPFPDGNVADFRDRWALITEDTLPAYQDLITNRPDEAEAVLRTDVHERVEDMRTLPDRLDDIVRQLLDWETRFEQ